MEQNASHAYFAIKFYDIHWWQIQSLLGTCRSVVLYCLVGALHSSSVAHKCRIEATGKLIIIIITIMSEWNGKMAFLERWNCILC